MAVLTLPYLQSEGLNLSMNKSMALRSARDTHACNCKCCCSRSVPCYVVAQVVPPALHCRLLPNKDLLQVQDFFGVIDEMRMWKVARTHEQLQEVISALCDASCRIRKSNMVNFHALARDSNT